MNYIKEEFDELISKKIAMENNHTFKTQQELMTYIVSGKKVQHTITKNIYFFINGKLNDNHWFSEPHLYEPFLDWKEIENKYVFCWVSDFEMPYINIHSQQIKLVKYDKLKGKFVTNDGLVTYNKALPLTEKEFLRYNKDFK